LTIAVWNGSSRSVAYLAAPPQSNLSTDMIEELTDVDIGIVKCAFERVTINFVVERKHNPSSVRMFHLDVATLAVNLYETEALQGCEHFPTREQG
jgi:hypothetical protein